MKSNFFWMLAGQLIYAACQWLALITIAKLGTPEIVGEFAFALALTSPILIFFSLNMRVFQATDANNEYGFQDYLLARFVQLTLALLTISIISYFGGYTSSITSIIGGVSLYKAIESVSDIYYGRLQNLEKMPRIGRSLMMRGALFAMSIFVGMQLAGSVILGVMLSALAWLLLLLFYDAAGVRIDLRNRHYQILDTVWRLNKKCFPLGVVAFLVSLNANIPTYVIKSYLGIEQVGIFAAIVYFSVAGQFITGALAQAAAPRLAFYYARAEVDGYKSLQLRLIGIGAGMGILGVLFILMLGKQVLSVFYDVAYAEHVDVFLWVMVSAGIGYAAIFLGTGLTVARRFREMVFLNVFSVIATAAFSLLFVPEYGMMGAGWALAASATLKLVFNLVIHYSVIYPNLEQIKTLNGS